MEEGRGGAREGWRRWVGGSDAARVSRHSGASGVVGRLCCRGGCGKLKGAFGRKGAELYS